MLRSLDEATLELLRQRAPSRDRRGREATKSTPAWRSRRSTAPTRRAASPRSRRFATASGRMSATGWRRCSRRPPTAAFVESRRRGPARRSRGRAAASTRSRSFYAGIETLFFGLSLGSVLVLVAIGLAITFGVMGVINMAHGELMMLGAYTTYVVQLLMPDHIGASILVAIPAAFLVAGAGGRAPRADDHPLSLRPAARDAARDVRRQPGAAAARAVDLLGQQPRGRDAGLDERHAPDQRSARASPTTASTSSSSR